MSRTLIALVTLVAALALAPAASADTFTVTDGDNSGGGSFREAISDANAAAGADEIVFDDAVSLVTVTSDGLELTEPVTISDPEGVEIRWSGTPVDPLEGLLTIRPGAAGSTISGLRFTRPGSDGDGFLIRAEGAVTLVGLVVNRAATNGIEVAAPGVAISGTIVSASGGHGIDLGGTSSTVSRGSIFGNGLLPIANAAISAPQALRVGPRGADGTLPLTGITGAGGLLEVFSGDPAGSTPIEFLADLGVAAGTFSFLPSPEPAPGARFSATIRNGGTSAFATAVVPDDVVSPDLVGAVAASTTEVRVQVSEPVDPASVQPEDFQLEMAGAPRAVTGVAVDPAGTQVTLVSSGWIHGEAGFVQLSSAGALTDAVGNANLSTTRFRVAAAPGDFLPPVPSSLAIRPRRICLTKSRRCRRTGATVKFLASEAGRARLVILRGNRRVGVDEAIAVAGRNAIRFNGRLRGRKLRAGSYRMLLYLEDAVGNETVEPAIQRFEVRRSTSRR